MGLQDLFRGTATIKTTPAASLTTGSYKLNKVKLDLKTAAGKVATKEGQRDLLLKQRDDAEQRKAAAEAQLAVLDNVLILLQKTSEYARQQTKGRIEELVSQALNIVYGGSHVFIMDLVTRANRPEVDYYLNDGNTIVKLEKPDYNQGGGKINIITIALRLAIHELIGEGPLLLDEIGANVDGEAAVNLAYFLKEYSIKFNQQILLITHNDSLAEIADVSLKVNKVNGIGKVKATVEGGVN